MKMSNFQLIALVLFGFFILLGVGIFAAFGGLLGGTAVGPVSMWGTVPSSAMEEVLAELRSSDKAFEDFTYVEKNPATYSTDLVNAMASGNGPDLFLVTDDTVTSFANKLTPIPYGIISQAEFNNSFIDEGQLLLTPQGILGLPFMIDPLVMYWNRDLFASAGLAQAPQYWGDFITIAPKLTSHDTGSNVQKAAVALGTWKNITHAKHILAALFMQAGDSIVVRNGEGIPTSVFGQMPPSAPRNPAESALQFYTEFANPGKTSYSWNNALPQSSIAFANGDLGAYFGFASEYASISARNPNLSYAVATLPQLKGNTTKLTYGKMTAVSLSRTSKNPNGAILVAKQLTGQKAISLFAQKILLPPVRRDVALNTSGNAAAATFVQSGLIARAWLDPLPSATDKVFQNMVEQVLSGSQQPAGAVAEGAQALNQAFSQIR